MYLRLGSHEIHIRVVLAVFGALAVVAVLIVVAVMVGGRSVDNGSETVEIPVVPSRFDWIDADDLVVEDELARGTEIRWIPFRPRKERWTESDVEEHWIDPRQIGIDVLETQVNDDIRLMLEDVP
ncbi:MAG: hypothetical protein KOO61_10300 [Spirochaetales bacterium]|nr:hypothetical protein [Spirochaetales bacterium]